MKHFSLTDKKGEREKGAIYFSCPEQDGCGAFHIEPENKKVVCEYCQKDITSEAEPYLAKGWDDPKNY